MILGLTGLIAAGKTTVSSYLVSKNAVLIDADVVARDVMNVGEACYNEVVSTFKEYNILELDKTVNRRKLGSIVFNDSKKLELLTEITHRYIKSEIISMINNIPTDKFILLDAPLLFEAELHKLCDIVWIISSSYDIRLNRIIKRDNLSKKDALSRINSRLDLPVITNQVELSKIKIFKNDDDCDLLLSKVATELKKVKNAYF